MRCRKRDVSPLYAHAPSQLHTCTLQPQEKFLKKENKGRETTDAIGRKCPHKSNSTPRTLVRRCSTVLGVARMSCTRDKPLTPVRASRTQTRTHAARHHHHGMHRHVYSKHQHEYHTRTSTGGTVTRVATIIIRGEGRKVVLRLVERTYIER